MRFRSREKKGKNGGLLSDLMPPNRRKETGRLRGGRGLLPSKLVALFPRKKGRGKKRSRQPETIPSLHLKAAREKRGDLTRRKNLIVGRPDSCEARGRKKEEREGERAISSSS